MTDGPRKLLIVEDDPGIQNQLRWCFEDYDVIFSADRPSALAEVRRHEPCVVLQDLGLPPDAEGVSEGLATLEEILAMAPHTKVVVVTGNGDKDNAVRAVGGGAYDFYQKPIDADVLVLIVKRAFHMHALEEQNRRLLSTQGEAPLDGALITCEHGKGRFTYTGISLFRQLPAGVPGAYRLLANLLARRSARE